MEFIVSTSDLLSQLNIVKSVINSKNTLPILDNFLFQLNGKTLQITASDLETTLNTEIEIENAKGSGIIAIEAKRLTDLLKEFTDQPLTFKINTENFHIDIQSASGKYAIVGQNGDEFPKIPEIQEEKITITLGSELVQKAISSTIFATGDDEMRPVMNGILVELTEEYFRMVATDSHKLARYTRNDVKANKDATFILPKKTATILKNTLIKDGNDITIEFDSKNAFFKLTDYNIVCRLIEGKYPAYNAVIPTQNTNKLLVDRMDLYSKLKVVSIFANPASNLAKLEMGGAMLNISAQDIDFSTSAQEQLNCKYEGEAMSIGFKSKFLLEILQNIESVDVNVELSDPSRAGLIIPIDKDDENEDILMLLMPMMI
ncbi:MAG: DNA polymerase III subunit beta [Bacteroidales bacterium]|jgi:DNA polymerase-3 subunit beta|nr:DNA polymerase III subunit beta [Bacteroidales bacterium]